MFTSFIDTDLQFVMPGWRYLSLEKIPRNVNGISPLVNCTYITLSDSNNVPE